MLGSVFFSEGPFGHLGARSQGFLSEQGLSHSVPLLHLETGFANC
jgi:hypothetical protein